MAISWDIIKTQLHKKYIVLSTLCLQICQLSRAPALFIAVIKFPFYTMGKYSELFFIYLAKLAFFPQLVLCLLLWILESAAAASLCSFLSCFPQASRSEQRPFYIPLKIRFFIWVEKFD